MWRVSSKDGTRWVQYNGPTDIETAPAGQLADLMGDDPIEIGPHSGRWYTPTRFNDPTAVFLRALDMVGGTPVVQGAPPQLPAVRASRAPAIAGLVN